MLRLIDLLQIKNQIFTLTVLFVCSTFSSPMCMAQGNYPSPFFFRFDFDGYRAHKTPGGTLLTTTPKEISIAGLDANDLLTFFQAGETAEHFACCEEVSATETSVSVSNPVAHPPWHWFNRNVGSPIWTLDVCPHHIDTVFSAYQLPPRIQLRIRSLLEQECGSLNTPSNTTWLLVPAGRSHRVPMHTIRLLIVMSADRMCLQS